MNKDYNEYMIDADNCPENDSVLTQYTCSGCPHYKEFFLYTGQRCIRCSYYQDIGKEDN